MFYNPQKNIAFQSNEPPKEENVFIQMLSGSRARGGVLLTRERSVLFPLRHTFPPKSEAEVRVDNETKWIRFPSQNVGFDGYVEMNAKGLAVDVGAPLWQIVDNKQRIAARCTVAGKPIQVRSNSGEVVSLPSSIVLDIYENTGPDKRRHLQHITTITNVDQNAPLTEGQFRVSLQSGTVIRNKLLGTTLSDVSDDTLLIDLIERNLSLLETAPSAQNRNTGERGTEAGTPTPREETHSARSETDEDRQSTSAVVRETAGEKENVDYGYVYLLAAIFAALGAFLAYYLYHKIQGRRMAYQKLK
jgi:hypothetical protein